MTRHEARSGNGVGAVWLNNKRKKGVSTISGLDMITGTREEENREYVSGN